MQQQRRHDTAIELALRSEIFRHGLRYFVHRRPVASVRREADILFPGARVAVFVDSCWWHACHEHGTLPRSNRQWWKTKFDRTRQRDLDTNARLKAAGWEVIRVWEHENVVEAGRRVVTTVAAQRKAMSNDWDRQELRRARGQGSVAQRSQSAGAG